MKKNTQKNLLLLGCFAAFGFAGYLLYKRYMLAKVDKASTNYADALAVLDNGGKTTKKNTNSKKQGEPVSARKPSDPLYGLELGKNVDKDRVLSKGMKTNEVKVMQAMLNKKLPYYEALTVDGAFGSKTEAALKKLTGKTQITLSELSVKIAVR